MTDQLLELTKDEEGTYHCVTGGVVCSILPDVQAEWVGRRNFIKGIGSGASRKIEVMRCKLPDGTLIFVHGNSVIITKTEMYL
jgi:hypothetical protein